ncbi:hypothetical protein SLEP1_g2146 [Rubroshorea leprosula]|uniref:Pentatricopeptide repeat-containing protein n=1 Tax=Rubroshorea leprosula TaxID=152421 RepID=A0AAV5HKM3_9ROSI|nr:hypothetical protein SLEP1_g2146 [Rubroshorea leprosula]
MCQFLRRIYGSNKTALAYYTHVIEHVLSIGSFDFAQIIHAQLIKVGFNRITFLGNRCLQLYFKFGAVSDALKVFDDISTKNTISWNICLSGLFKFGYFQRACSLFDKMPVRDVVSYNSMISGFASCGLIDYAFGIFLEMQKLGVRPSGFTFSILTSFVCCGRHGKQIHGRMIRSGVNLSNLVLGNSLIDMYGKLGLLHYALGVFMTMEEVDIVSWNSLITSCCKSGHEELALKQFYLMRSAGYLPDEFTISTAIAACTKLGDLDKGNQMFAFSLKVAFLSNSIVLSAIIDLFSKCNRLEDSVQLFEDVEQLDSVLCNSMISGYARHGLWEDSLRTFLLTFREGLRPTDFTLNNVLSSTSLLSTELGSQVHSLLVKLGFESEAIVATSLVDMYTKIGLIDCAMKIFFQMDVRDLISWNTLILGLARNGRYFEALGTFKELIRRGSPPDRITLAGVLSACRYGGFVDEGMSIFSSMEEEYGVEPCDEHYACIVDLLCQAGKLKEAIDTAEAMPSQPSSFVWEPILIAAATIGDLNLIERVAERMMTSEPQSSLPYLLLVKAYEMRGRWEGMIRVMKAMKQRGLKNITGCSWIGIKNSIFAFEADQLEYPSGQEIYVILRLLSWEVGEKDNILLHND